MFAIRDDGTINYHPKLEFIPDVTLREGDGWFKILIAEDGDNDVLTFSSNSNLFSVSEDGVINITAPAADKYKVTFTVIDDNNETDSQTVTINVLAKRDE